MFLCFDEKNKKAQNYYKRNEFKFLHKIKNFIYLKKKFFNDIFKNILLGSGMSSVVYFNSKKDKLTVITGDEKKTLKSKNFYEYDAFGGNSNIWGGYINFSRNKKFLKNRNYSKLFKKKLFEVKKIFSGNSYYANTTVLLIKIKKSLELKDNILKKVLLNKVSKIIIKKKFIELITQKKILY